MSTAESKHQLDLLRHSWLDPGEHNQGLSLRVGVPGKAQEKTQSGGQLLPSEGASIKSNPTQSWTLPVDQEKDRGVKSLLTMTAFSFGASVPLC